jgi:hypothetical protein
MRSPKNKATLVEAEPKGKQRTEGKKQMAEGSEEKS